MPNFPRGRGFRRRPRPGVGAGARPAPVVRPAGGALGRGPGQVDHHRSRLGGDEGTGGVVPAAQAQLVVGVHPADGHRAQVQSGRSHPADVADLGQEQGHHLSLVAALVGLVSEARGHQGPAQVGFVGNRDGLAVASGACASDGPEGVPGDHVDHHSGLHHSSHLSRDRHGHARVAVDVVGGAVEGIDDPAHPRGAGPIAALLAQHAVVGAGAEELPDDELLGRSIHLGDDVGGARLGRHRCSASLQRLGQHVGRGLGGLFGQVGQVRRVGRTGRRAGIGGWCHGTILVAGTPGPDNLLGPLVGKPPGGRLRHLGRIDPAAPPWRAAPSLPPT